MNSTYHALRTAKINKTFKEGDVLVLFGELFNRGYANGLVEEAERRGIKIIRTTVGRREKDGILRPLTAEESSNVPTPFINVPLEAGFDMETDSLGKSAVDYLKDVKLSDWENFEFDKNMISEVQKKGRARFLNHLKNYIQELEKHIPEKSNVLFAHLMAGGVPRAKIIMPLMNRALKGTGERFLSSEKFWNSPIGQFCSQNFLEVTAETFNLLIEETTVLRKRQESHGQKVSYIGYGYHGTEVLVGHNYLWQTYTPYLQGWAKMRLENYAREWHKEGATACIYNCPEILTNSSSIFTGVELSLYPLVTALKKEQPQNPLALKIIDQCVDLLKPEHKIEDLLKMVQDYLQNELTRKDCDFEKWPQHNNVEHTTKMLETSDKAYEMHKDSKNIMTAVLSELVFESCGKAILNDCAQPESPVAWINHDLVARYLGGRIG